MILNQHKNVMSCNPWKNIFTLAKLAPLIVFSPLDFLDFLINSLMWLLPPSLLKVPYKIVDGTKECMNMEFGGYKT
jgi:hypothetical protein